jgi:hypothetical protein
LWGTTEKLVEATVNIDAFEPVVILRLRNMTAIDATGIHAIETSPSACTTPAAPCSSAAQWSSPPSCSAAMLGAWAVGITSPP